MTTAFSDLLNNHVGLTERKNVSESLVKSISEQLALEATIKEKCNGVTIFCAGSLGRLDSGRLSDWDVFIVSEAPSAKASRLLEIEVLASLVNVNKILKFQPFSNDGKFLKVHYLDDLYSSIGTPEDDFKNTFTARMLMLLESKCIWREPIYQKAIHQIVHPYFRDAQGRETFFLMFLLNDLLRYWRTLCLNYETIRTNKSWPWRKKNINLKFSRLLTVFSTVLCIVSEATKSEGDLHNLVSHTPLERVALSLDKIADLDLLPRFNDFLNDYETFLNWKDDPNIEEVQSGSEFTKKRLEMSDRFSDFLFDCAMHPKIRKEYRKYLVI